MPIPALTACDGPACTRCGCRDAQVLRPVGDSAWSPGKARCRHCGTHFSFALLVEGQSDCDESKAESGRRRADSRESAVRPPPSALASRPRCPECESVALSVERTMPKLQQSGSTVRYLRCDVCRASLKSVENARGEIRVAVVKKAIGGQEGRHSCLPEGVRG